MAAESLSEHEGDLLLNGLTELSDAAAESLSKYEGAYLCLNGLTSLSDEAILVLCECESIEHDGFGRDSSCPETIPETAKDFALARILACDEEQGRCYLWGSREGAPLFGELTLPQAEQLSRYADVDVCLNGWYSVESLDALKALSNGHFSSINLRFDEVTTEIASVLADFKSAGLGIESESIDEEAARLLLGDQGRFVGSEGVKSVFKWSGCREMFEQHPSMDQWGEISGLSTKVKLEGQCWACGQIFKAAVSIEDINAESGLGGLLNDGDDEVAALGPCGDYGAGHSGTGVCDTCRDKFSSTSEDDEDEDWDDED